MNLREKLNTIVRVINWQPGYTLEYVEKQSILEAYRHFGGNKSQTAQALGITLKTLYTKLEAYGYHEGPTTKENQDQAGNIQGNPERVSQAKQNSVQPETGFRVQPPVETTTQLPVSVQQREKVQTLPPKRVAANNTQRRKASAAR